MSDSWAQDIAREELLTAYPSEAEATPFADSPVGSTPLVSPACFQYYLGDLDTDYGTPSASDDGYDTACSPDFISSEMMKKNTLAKGRKRKRVENSCDVVESKKVKKNGSQRHRKREERYYMDALKNIFIQCGYIKTTTPKRTITHFETLKIARMKIKDFINDGVPNDRIKKICEEVLQKS